MGLKEEAAAVLQTAYAQATISPTTECKYKDFIDYVIDNTHLTYKYVLFTALLFKSTDESINALCLQKQSTLPGAYDARTVCHKVIVPFEMETLKKALGGSNEPFLNKPARFPELSKTNAVRKGNDQNILNSLCDNLPKIGSKEEAFQCLVYLLCKLIKIRDEKEKLTIFTVEDEASMPYKLFSYIINALDKSYEGEVLTLMVAGVYHLLYAHLPNAIVEVHPVNQSGASSREVSDLDIYVGDNLISSNELKDKEYAETDVRHAADKVIQAGGTKLLFIEGPRGNAISGFTSSIKSEYAKRNFQLSIVSYRQFFEVIVGIIPEIDCQSFMTFILTAARETKFKEEVVSYLDELAQKELGLSRQ